MSDQEQHILAEEKEILREIQKEKADIEKEITMLERISRNMTIVLSLLGLLIVGSIGGFAYWYVSSQTVYVDQSVISAPIIALSPATPGILQEVFVKEGDDVHADTPIARVGDEIVKAKTDGEIISVNDNIGQSINAMTGGTVASMIDRSALRVIGHLREDKGLADVTLGDRVQFTVDAFGSKSYEGVVDEISPTSRQSDVVFNISDQRPTNEFDIKVRFDPQKYPELKNGMSAKMWIYK